MMAKGKQNESAQKIWSKVYHVYQDENPPNILPGHAATLATLARDWQQSGDPSCMDAVISFCQAHRLPILPVLVECLDAAMQKRIRDGQSPNRAFRVGARERMLEEMAKLIYHDASLERAADWAAASQFNQFKIKSSTLQKAYAEDRERLETFAAELFGGLKESPEYEEIAARWRSLATNSPNLSPELKGERR